MFYKGVIEGFYGRPWTHEQRVRLLRMLPGLGLNTYTYAPKNDLLHRRQWRESYDNQALKEFRELGRVAVELNLILVFSLSPGLNINYSSRRDVELLINKFKQMKKAGFNAFALLVDDIPDKLNSRDRKKYPSLAEAHSDLANQIYQELACPHFFLCPTYYSYDRCTDREVLFSHLQTLGKLLHPDIQVFWTGNETIAEKILPSHITPVSRALKRKPLIWDNYFADDYIINRIFLGPLYGRSPSLLPNLNGLLINPSCFFEVACMSLISSGEYLNRPVNYRPKQAYSRALVKTAGRQYSEPLRAISDIHHAPFIRTSLTAILRDCLIESSSRPRAALRKFLRHKQVKQVNQMWELERMKNNDFYLNIFPYAVYALKLVGAIETCLRWKTGQPDMSNKLALQMNRMGCEAGKTPEIVLLSLLD